MKKIIYSIIAISIAMCSFASCNDSKTSATDSSSKQATETAAVSEESSEAPDTSVTPDQAEQYVKELYDAAQTIADRYCTSGGIIMSTLIKNTEADGDAEKANICNMINNIYTHGGVWAFQIENFKIINAVYTPYDNSGIVARYPKAYDGSTDNITAENIQSCLS